MNFWKTALKFAAIGAAVIYLTAVTALFILQRSLIYDPDAEYRPPASVKGAEGLREFPVVTEDGLALKAWYAPGSNDGPILVFFHGNGDRLATAAGLAAPFTAAGYGFLIAEYRGYSGMPGEPNEAGLYADGRAYLKALIASGVHADRIILLGHSLGTGVAVQLATEFPVGGVILAAPFRSLAGPAQAAYPFVPVGLLLLDRFDSEAKIGRIHAPLLIVHGDRDSKVPLDQGKALFAAASEPKRLVVLPDQGHNTLFGQEGMTAMLGWLGQLFNAG